MRKVVIEISQGSVVTQTMLGGLAIYLPVANVLCFIPAKNYENWPRVDKVIAMNTVCSFFWPTRYSCSVGLSLKFVETFVSSSRVDLYIS